MQTLPDRTLPPWRTPPFLGVGIGFRHEHRRRLFDMTFDRNAPRPDWLEIISENFMDFGGEPREVLQRALSQWTIIPHGVALSLGSPDPLKEEYLAAQEKLLRHLNPPWFSDHLCFSSFGKHEYQDLLPIPFTKETLEWVASKVNALQTRMQRLFVVENVSAYLASPISEFSEGEFLAQLSQRTNCGLLVDVNNVYVNYRNHGHEPAEFFDSIPLDKVVQIHLAGHDDRGDLVLDTHGDFVRPEVWDLYKSFLLRLGRPVSTLIEWDQDIPSLETLLQEADRARTLLKETVL